MNVSLAGSIQIDVPVKPVWPKLPIGKRSPRLAEKPVAMSQPTPRAKPSRIAPAHVLQSCGHTKGDSNTHHAISPPFRIIGN